MSKQIKDLTVISENKGFFSKILNFLKGFFKKEKNEPIYQNDYQDNEEKITIKGNKNNFLNRISYKENQEELTLIKKVQANKSLIHSMSSEDLEKLNEAIANRKSFLSMKIDKLKNDIVMKENMLKKSF